MRMAEVDLHGHTVDEALRIFIDVYNRHVRSRSKESLRVIHGYGSATEGLDGGRIRRKIRTFLEAPRTAWIGSRERTSKETPALPSCFPVKSLRLFRINSRQTSSPPAQYPEPNPRSPESSAKTVLWKSKRRSALSSAKAN